MRICNSIREYCNNVFDSYYSLGIIKPNDIIKDDLYRFACSDDFDEQKQVLKMLCYYYGYGTERDDDLFYQSASSLADKYNPHGLYFMGLIHNFGYCGLEVNRDIAYDYYYKSIEAGDIHRAKESICQLILFGHENKHNINVLNTLYDLCNNNSDFAYHLLSLCYKKGFLVEKSGEKFLHYAKLAVENGSYLPLISIGEYYYNNKDYDNAFIYFEKSANANYARGHNWLGYMYEHAYGCDKNFEKALQCYLKAKELGYNYANFRLGSYYFLYPETRDYKKALDYYTIAAELKIPEAISMLGHYYYNGYNTVTIDYETALKYYTESHNLGYVVATYMIAECYYYGRGIEKNLEEAFKYYKLAAEKGYSSAIHSTGWCYYKGVGTEKDYSKAIEYFTKSAEYNNSQSIYLLGNCHYYGRGTIVNKAKSVEFYRRAAELKHPNAIYAMGHAYYTGAGVPIDYNQAFIWLKKGAEANDLDSIDLLGDCYYYGRGTTKNTYEACRLYKQAADRGCTRSYYSLGYSYYYGDGTTVNKIEGIKYFIKATDDHNSKFALKRLAEIVIEGSAGYQLLDIKNCIRRALSKGIINDPEAISLARRAV